MGVIRFNPANDRVLVTAASGCIHYDDFVTVMATWEPKNMDEQLRDAFRVFDKDDSGTISADELKTVMKNLGERMTDSEVDDMVREIDLDGDGQIDFQGEASSHPHPDPSTFNPKP